MDDGILYGNGEVITLDDLIDEIPKDYYIGVMKLNVNGMEIEVMRGALEFIEVHRVPYIIIKMDKKFMKHQGYKSKQIFDLLNKQLKYAFHLEKFNGEIINDSDEIDYILNTKKSVYFYLTFINY